MKRVYLEFLSTAQARWQRYVLTIFTLNTLVSVGLLLLPLSKLAKLAQLEQLVLIIFLAEYSFRLYYAKRKLRYSLSLYGVIDVLAWLPLIAGFAQNLAIPDVLIGLEMIIALRVLKCIRLILAVKSQQPAKKSERVLIQALYQERELLIKIASILISLALTGALLVYSVEHVAQPDQFVTIFDAFWWAFITFTTVGYGDLYPITTFGRLIAMGLSILGIAMFAIPTTIISSALIQRLSQQRQSNAQPQTLSVRLTTLNDLYAQGQISATEYEQLRAKILNDL